MANKLDVKTVVFDPGAYFKTPKELLEDRVILKKKRDKINALRTWKLDLELKRVAEEENMRPLKRSTDEISMEEKVIKALATLEEIPTNSNTKLGPI